MDALRYKIIFLILKIYIIYRHSGVSRPWEPWISKKKPVKNFMSMVT